MEHIKYLLGNFGDNTWLLWEGLRIKYLFYDESLFGLYGVSGSNPVSEPIPIYLFLFFSKFINAIDLWNIFVITFLFLNLFFSFLYFRKIIDSKFIAFISSLVFISNSYFSIHSRDHLTLLCVFILPIFLLLNKLDSYRSLLYKYLFLAISSFISNYLTVFLIFLNFLDAIISYFSERNNYKKINLIFATVIVISSSIFIKTLFPQLSKNIDNFLIYSFKPWHLITQSPRALINISDFENLYPQNIWFQYFDAEHSVSYFGFTILIIFLIQLIRRNIIFNKNFYLLILLLLFSLPPYVVVKGIYIYLPSYIMYELFPAFRIISRMNIFSFFFLIVVILESFKKENLNDKKYLITILAALAILELFVPLKVSVTKDNKVYSYIRENYKTEKNLIFYPGETPNSKIIDMIHYRAKLINPQNYISGDFNSEEFTKNLDCKNLQKYNLYPKDVLILSTIKYNNILDIKLKQVSEDETEKLILYEIECEK
jgi:hypothetical protein